MKWHRQHQARHAVPLPPPALHAAPIRHITAPTHPPALLVFAVEVAVPAALASLAVITAGAGGLLKVWGRGVVQPGCPFSLDLSKAEQQLRPCLLANALRLQLWGGSRRGGRGREAGRQASVRPGGAGRQSSGSSSSQQAIRMGQATAALLP